MRTRHSAKGTADAEKLIGRADASEKLGEDQHSNEDRRTRSRVLRHNDQKFPFGIFFHRPAPFVFLVYYIILFRGLQYVRLQ